MKNASNATIAGSATMSIQDSQHGIAESVSDLRELRRQSVQKAEIIMQMRRLADAMKFLSEDMIYYGRLYDDPLFIHHGIDLMCASGLLADFQSSIERLENGK